MDREEFPKRQTQEIKKVTEQESFPREQSQEFNELTYCTASERSLCNFCPEIFQHCYRQVVLCVSHSSLYQVKISITVILVYNISVSCVWGCGGAKGNGSEII